MAVINKDDLIKNMIYNKIIIDRITVHIIDNNFVSEDDFNNLTGEEHDYIDGVFESYKTAIEGVLTK